MQQRRVNWNGVASDPDLDKVMKDLARIKVAEENEDIDDGEEERTIDQRWVYFVQGNEFVEGGATIISDSVLIHIAADALLGNEEEKGCSFALHKTLPNGRRDVFGSYPKLVAACRKHLNCDDNDLSADASIVLARFHAVQRNEDKAMNMNKKFGKGSGKFTPFTPEETYFKKALQSRPDDWRIYDALGHTFCQGYHFGLGIDYVVKAIEVAQSSPSPSTKVLYQLMEKKGKLLFFLRREQEAISTMEETMVLYEQIEDQLTPEEKGFAATTEHMLCLMYSQLASKDRFTKVLEKWESAEKIWATLPRHVIAKINHDTRDNAQIIVAQVKPDVVLSQRECDYCHNYTDDPKKCSACHTAVYCSKQCQIKAWKSGHKDQCKQLNALRKQEKKELKRSTLGEKVLLDKDLDPKQLWEDATEFVNAGNAEEAVWNFLLSLFLDPSMNDKQNLPLARKAVNLCSPSNRVAKVLSIMTHNAGNPLKKSQKMMLGFLDDEEVTAGINTVCSSLNEVDRDTFAYGAASVFYTRFVTNHDPLITRFVTSQFSRAKDFLNPNQWLTFQYEMGCKNVDILALDEAKHWLKCFLENLNEIEKKSGGLTAHLKIYQKLAEQKLATIPMLPLR